MNFIKQSHKHDIKYLEIWPKQNNLLIVTNYNVDCMKNTERQQDKIKQRHKVLESVKYHTITFLLRMTVLERVLY